jgi:NADH-quinone oxidoreductase subunit M
MPGSPNFIGELLILFGAFDSHLAWGLVASTGVALASVYMIRVFQRTMHNRVGPAVAARDLGAIDLAAVAPVVAVVVALGLYPQFVLDRSDEAVTGKLRPAQEVAVR